MLISDIELTNFRNYKVEKIKLNSNINIFYGDNAQGKTNFLEAIFVLAFGKSFRTNRDKELINKNENFSNIYAQYKNSYRDGKIKVQLSDKKMVEINGIKIKKLSEILGNINVVLFTPDDINILKSGPANRRRFLNMMISQIRPNYVYNLNLYMKTLEQRNNYLKKSYGKKIDESLMDIWDEKLSEYGAIVSNYRSKYIEKIQKKIVDIHSSITENKENINIKYVTDCRSKEDFIETLRKNRNNDIFKGYTTRGIQKDDFVIYINEEEVNIYGSQGQHRTSILSLKLCELAIIKEEIGENPILLLDDFMSELDDKRIKNFLKYIKDTQVIITCTKEIEISDISKSIFYVENGSIKCNNNIMKEV